MYAFALSNESFNEVVDPVADIDIGADQQTLAKIRDCLKVLGQYAVSFNDQRAVCQAQVKSLIENCDIALDDRYPIQSFTQAPTSQNLSVVTESVLHRAGSVVADLVKKTWELIVKFLKWLSEAFRNIFSREKHVQRRVQLIKVLHEANKEAAAAVGKNHPHVDTHGPEAQALLDAQAAYSEAVQLYQDNMTALAQNMLSEDFYLGILKGIALVLIRLTDIIRMKSEELEKTLITDPKSSTMLYTELAQLSEPLPINPPLNKYQAQWGALAGAKNLAEFMTAFKHGTDQLHHDRPSGSMDWEIAAAVVTAPNSAFAEPLVPVPDILFQWTDKLMQRVDTFKTPEVLKRIEPKHAALYEAALQAMSDEIYAMVDYAQAANIALDTQSSIVTRIQQCETAEYNLLRETAKIHPDATVLEKLNAIQANLRNKIVLRQQ